MRTPTQKIRDKPAGSFPRMRPARSVAALDALDPLDIGIMGMDSGGHLKFANSAGETMLRAGRWVHLTGGRLRAARGVVERDRLDTMLQSALVLPGKRMLITHADSGLRALIQGAAVQPRPVRRAADARVLLWVAPLALRKDAAGELAELFGLSLAETRLVQGLIAGADLGDVARQLGISIHTARSQLKAIFRKTSCGSQAQLLALAARLSLLTAERR